MYYIYGVRLHPHSGWPQEAPQRGAFTWESPVGAVFNYFQIKFHLLLIKFS